MENIEVYGDGFLVYHGKRFRCVLGRSGITKNKHEGDGATPAGVYPLREVLFRADRLGTPKTVLHVRALTEHDGWCDDVGLPEYNTLVTLPFSGSHEKLWRNDDVYDIIVPLGYNDDPVIRGKGSAIFMHIAREDYTPTDGCIALPRVDLLEILSGISLDTVVVISSDLSGERKTTP